MVFHGLNAHRDGDEVVAQVHKVSSAFGPEGDLVPSHLTEWRIDAAVPGWSADFDAWAADALSRGDVEALANYRSEAPGMPYSHPTVEHYTPLFVTLGAAANPDRTPEYTVDGYWYGLAKRSLQVA